MNATAAPRPPRVLDRVNPRWHRPLKVAAGMAILFLIGYVVAVYLLFPPPAVPRDGVVVPDLSGNSLRSTYDLLRPLGLVVGDTVSMPTTNVAPGIVVAQSPLPGQQLRPGDSVRVGLSSGMATALVPDVVGLGARRAENLLKRLGFEVDQTFESSFRPNGTVTRTSPQAGDRKPLPARVLIVVSGGPPDTVTIPVDTIVRDTVPLPPHSPRP